MRDIFESMDKMIARHRTNDPFQLLDAMGVIVTGISSHVIGYVMRHKKVCIVGYNTTLPESAQRFTLMHECEHILDHIPTGRLSPHHQEIALFTMDKSIAVEEREANLCAAEYTIPTEDVLELIGYHNRAVRRFIQLQTEINKSRASGQPWSEDLRYKLEEMSELEIELSTSDAVQTTGQIARMLGYNKAFIEYKLEALRLRGYDIPPQELLASGRVFNMK